MQITRLSSMVVQFIAVFCCVPFVFSEEPRSADQLKKFGETVGKPVESGFVFVDGRYINAPYRVCRRGLRILISDTPIAEWKQRPLPDEEQKAASDDPGMPKGISEKSSWDDYCKLGHGALKYRYLEQHFGSDGAMPRMLEYYRQLPFVKSVTLKRARDFSSVLIKCRNGGEELVDLRGLRPSGDIRTKKDIVDTLDGRRLHFEERLKAGACFFLSTKGPTLWFGRKKAARDLNLIVGILRSEKALEEKRSLLQRMGMLPPHPTGFSALLTSFKGSEQLDDRISALVRDTGVSPRKLEDLPESVP